MELSLKEGLNNIRSLDIDGKGKYGGSLLNEIGSSLKKTDHPITIENGFIILASFASIAQCELKEEPNIETFNLIALCLRWSQYPSDHTFSDYQDTYNQIKKYSSSNLDEYLNLLPKEKRVIIDLLFSLFGSRDNKIPRAISALCSFYEKNKHWELGAIEREFKPEPKPEETPTPEETVGVLGVSKSTSGEHVTKGSHASSSSSSSKSGEAITKKPRPSSPKPSSSKPTSPKPTSPKPTSPKPTSPKPTSSSSHFHSSSSSKTTNFVFSEFALGFALGLFLNWIGLLLSFGMGKNKIIGAVVGFLVFVGIALLYIHAIGVF